MVVTGSKNKVRRREREGMEKEEVEIGKKLDK